MIQQKILENNRLIAEFMGATYGEDGPNEVSRNAYMKLPTDKKGQKTLVENGYTFPKWTFAFSWLSELRYHSSWEWLMPVVLKISEISQNNSGIANYIENAGFNALVYYNGDLYAGYNLSEAHEEIVKIIKWYNKKKK